MKYWEVAANPAGSSIELRTHQGAEFFILQIDPASSHAKRGDYIDISGYI